MTIFLCPELQLLYQSNWMITRVGTINSSELGLVYAFSSFNWSGAIIGF
jgi:hypothetical protein